MDGRMTPTRRRFFGFAAAVPVVAALPSIPAPAPAFSSVAALAVGDTFTISGSSATYTVEAVCLSDWNEAYLRPQIRKLAEMIDRDLVKMYGGRA